MALKVVGAGLPRTGTASLKQALERLLGGRCYHMLEVLDRPEDIPGWRAAFAGEPTNWKALLGAYESAVDWPSSAFWREISAANPDALVVLSTRASAEEWWRSVQGTVLQAYEREHSQPELSDFGRMLTAAVSRAGFTDGFTGLAPATEAYDRHNRAVRAAVPSNRLLDWQPGDGWEPLCSRLGLAIPAEPFPHNNTTAEFRTRAGLG